jgi:hypothetical protein
MPLLVVLDEVACAMWELPSNLGSSVEVKSDVPNVSTFIRPDMYAGSGLVACRVLTQEEDGVADTPTPHQTDCWDNL